MGAFLVNDVTFCFFFVCCFVSIFFFCDYSVFRSVRFAKENSGRKPTDTYKKYESKIKIREKVKLLRVKNILTSYK